MSNRINQLIEECTSVYDDVIYDGRDTRWKTTEYFDKQKFAELIVRECAKFCEHESNDDEHDEYDMGMWVKAESIKTAIIEEFGIKE